MYKTEFAWTLNFVSRTASPRTPGNPPDISGHKNLQIFNSGQFH